MDQPRFRELTREESIRRLAGIGVGRLVFTHQALPAIRPLHHLVDDGQVIIRGHGGSALRSALDTVVAYEADELAEDGHIRWSVVVTGVARLVDPAAVTEEYLRLADPWDGEGGGCVLRIRPELIAGMEVGRP